MTLTLLHCCDISIHPTNHRIIRGYIPAHIHHPCLNEGIVWAWTIVCVPGDSTTWWWGCVTWQTPSLLSYHPPVCTPPRRIITIIYTAIKPDNSIWLLTQSHTLDTGFIMQTERDDLQWCKAGWVDKKQAPNPWCNLDGNLILGCFSRRHIAALQHGAIQRMPAVVGLY